jgi:O-antigen/teichoic acid export membrane protein
MKTKSLLMKTALTGVVKFAAAFIAFAMTAMITNLLGAEESGLFFLATSILAFLCVLFRFGLDSVVLRLLSAGNLSHSSLSAMKTGVFVVFILSLFVSILVSISSDYISTTIFSKPDFSSTLGVIILALPFIVVFMLLSYGFQAFYRVIVATFFQNLGVYSFFIISFLIFSYYEKWEGLSAANASVIYLCSAIVIFFFALYMWNRQVKGYWGDVQLNNVSLWSSASNLWVATIMSLAVHWSGILIAGIYVNAEDIAYFSTAQRTAVLTSFVLTVVNIVIAPRYARLWQSGNMDAIQKLARWSSRALIVIALPIVSIMVLFSDYIMSYFGDNFSGAGKLLAIMAVGQFINVATGTVFDLLVMSGHEKDFRRVTFFSGPLTIILCLILIPIYGVTGAAVATAIGLSAQNIFAVFMVRKRLGFWPVG